MAEKKDYSTAILEKKKSPNRVMVDDTPHSEGDNAAQDENSVVYIHPDLMEELGFFRGDWYGRIFFFFFSSTFCNSF